MTCRGSWLALLLLLAASAAAAAPGCAPGTVITLVGADTAAGRILLAAPDASGRPVDLIEVGGIISSEAAQPSAPSARLIRGAARDTAAGSIGPNAVMVAASCGVNCIQARVWRGNAWVLLGEPLAAPERAVSHSVYDRSGIPWLVLHEPGSARGFVVASAFRLQGLDWAARGRQQVSDFGSPGALAVPDLDDGITSGTGLFTATAVPGYWLQGLPEVTVRGEVTPLGGAAASYLDGTGRIFFTSDRGATWRRSTWNPLAGGGSGLSPAFQYGTDWTVEAAAGGRRSPLALAWFDRRVPAEPALVLTTANAQAAFHEFARVPALQSEGGRGGSAEAAEEAAFVVAGDGGNVWWLLGGTCVGGPDGPAVTLRVAEGGRRAAVRRLRLVE